jgi:hypothetical protein
MVLSVSATFAADDNATDAVALDDGVTEDVVASGVDDSDKLSVTEVVTKENFGNYFNSTSGELTSDADELVFKGDFSGLDVSAITLAKDKAVKFTGDNATFKNVQFIIMQDDVTIDGFNFVTDDANEHAKLIYIIGASDVVSNIVLSNNNIQFIAPKGDDGYAIFAGAESAMGSCAVSGLQILNNTITYVGNTDGTTINNVIRVNGDEDNMEASDSILVKGNTFDIQMPSVDVYYDPMTWDSTTMAEGIAFYYCEDVKFLDNRVNMKYNNATGSWDSLYVVAVRGLFYGYYSSSDIEISGNEINATGNSYLYGITVSGDGFYIANNKLNMSADKTQVNGINVDGPADNGEIFNNTVKLSAPMCTYGIYSWQMYGGINDVSYINNTINVNSYLACGMEINQPDSNIEGNYILALGNFTYGIAASIKPTGDFAVIRNNTIICAGNNVGFGSGDSILKTGSAGISTLGSALIMDNKIISSCVGIVSVGEAGIESNVSLEDNKIFVLAYGNVSNYAIKATATDKFVMNHNNVTFIGTTNGTVITNGVYIFDTLAEVSNNTFNLIIPAADISYGPAPTYEETVVAEGIVFDYVDDLLFDNNDVTVNYSSIIGYFDTIRAIDITNSANVRVTDNKINATGNSYIYALRVSGDLFGVSYNEIIVKSNNYAAGIEVAGPATGYIDINNITAEAPLVAYGIYSYQYGNNNISVNYIDNNISCNAYASCGMEIVNVAPLLTGNIIYANGNHTMGIVLDVSEQAVLNNNTIYSLGSNEGSNATGDGMIHLESTGIAVNGDAQLLNGKIYSTAIGVDLTNQGKDGEIDLWHNEINVAAKGNCDNYAVYVDGIKSIRMQKNNIAFEGKTNGTIISNGVYIFDTIATILDNNFDLVIPAADIIYGPAPAYAETVVAEGIVIDYVDNLFFEENNVTVTYGDIVGYFDTIRAIDITNSDNATVLFNKINATGNSYIYAIKLTGDNFEISDNEIVASSNSYANGIDIESPATGVINHNKIDAKAPDFSYPIYAGMNAQDVSTNITNNDIAGEAYYVVGIEVGGDKVVLDNNNIAVKGNHTIGVGAYVNELEVNNSTIVSDASNEGDIPIWDNMGTDTTGIKVAKGNFSITNNDVDTTGDYAAILGDNSGNVTNNMLTSNNGAGNDALIGLGNVNATGNPETRNKILKVVLFADNFTKVYGSDDQFTVKILDENGKPVANKTIKLSINGTIHTSTSDADGKASFDINLVSGEYFATVKFDGDADYSYKSATATVTVTPKPTAITASAVTVLLTKVKSGYNYEITLKDNSGNVLSGRDVSITFNGKTNTYKTNPNGVISYKLAATKTGSYKLTAKFAGEENYAASTKTATIKLTKEASKLTAAKKTFKAKTKVKKYTVTLKDSKGKAIKKVKLTLKIKGKTYKAKTNAKGKAVFKIKKLAKKGKYTAKVKFAGNAYYKGATKSVKITVKK